LLILALSGLTQQSQFVSLLRANAANDGLDFVARLGPYQHIASIRGFGIIRRHFPQSVKTPPFFTLKIDERNC
jgi:hypothetical protein